jgi:ADP-ribose pyrophosphatase
MSQWKIVSQKTTFKSELFDVKEVALENSEKKKKLHHEAERVPVVTIFPLTNKYEVYLVSQYRQMLKRTVLEAPSGYIKPNESIIAAAKRELREEVGIEAEQLEEIARVELAASVFKSKVNLFLAKGLEIGKNNPEEDEEIEVIKMPLKRAVEKVMLGEINHSATMVGILMLDKLRREKKL